jgi:hypothetical protein
MSPNEASDDVVDLGALRRYVESQIDGYIYVVPEGAVGQPMGQDWLKAGLQKMRESLVDPYWIDVRIGDTWEQIHMRVEELEMRRCAVVADDREGTLLLWDPVTGEFVLASNHSGQLGTFNVRGDAVGCFLAI